MKTMNVLSVFALCALFSNYSVAQSYGGIVRNDDSTVFCTYHIVDTTTYSAIDLSNLVCKYITDIEKKMVFEKKFEFKKGVKKYTYPDSSGFWQGAKFFRIIPISPDSTVLDSIVIPPSKPESTINFEKPTVYYAEGYLPDTTSIEEIKITRFKSGEENIYVDYRFKNLKWYGVQIYMTLKNLEVKILDIIEYDDDRENDVNVQIFSYNSKTKEIMKITPKSSDDLVGVRNIINLNEFTVNTRRIFEQFLYKE